MRWHPTGEGRAWVSDGPALAGYVMYKRWLSSTVGPFVVIAPDEHGNPGKGQCIAWGLSSAAASSAAVAELSVISARRGGGVSQCE